MKFLVAILLLSAALHAADKEDSLRNLLKEIPEDTEKVNTLNRLAYHIRNRKPQESVELSAEAMKLAGSTGHPRGMANALLNTGFAYRSLNEPDKAIHYYQQALSKAKECGSLSIQANVYNALGNIYNALSNMYISLDYHKKALAIRKASGDSAGYALSLANMSNVLSKLGKDNEAKQNFMTAIQIQRRVDQGSNLAVSLNGLANIYVSERNYRKALETYRMALDIFRETGDERGAATVTNNMGNCHFYLEDYSSASGLYEEAFGIAEKIKDLRAMARALMNKGAVLTRMHKPAEALPLFERALSMYREAKDKTGEADVLAATAMSYILLGSKKESEEYISMATRISIAINNRPQLIEMYKGLYEAYLELKDHEKALVYHQRMVAMQDSLNTEEKKIRTDELEAAFDLKEKEFRIETLSRENIMNEEKIRNQRIIVIASAAFAVIFLVMLVMIWRSYRKNRESNLALGAAYAVIQEKNKNISDSIQYAKRIQEAMMVPAGQISGILGESFVLFFPRDVVSGDFYWIADIPIHTGPFTGEKVAGVAAVDCTGHGVPGALMSMMANTLFNQTLKEDISSPGDALTYLHRQLPVMLRTHGQSGSVKDGMDVAFISIHFERKQVLFAGANNPLILISGNELKEFKGDKMAIGGPEPSFVFGFQRVSVQPGDMLYLFSDGYADQFGGPKGKKLNKARFRAILKKLSALPVSVQRAELEKEFNEWKGAGEQVDDVLVIGIRV